MRTFILAVAIVSALFLCAMPAAQADDLITNGDFSAGSGGLGGWTTFGESNGAYIYGFVGSLTWFQQNGGVSGNAAGAYQTIGADVSSFANLVFSCDVMPRWQTLDAPGWAGGGIEYPVHIAVAYQDTLGFDRSYEHGFYYSGNGSGVVPGTYVPQNTWYSFTSPDLMGLTDKPKLITSVSIYGNGWNYWGSADNVKLQGSVAPEPASMILFGLGSAVMVWRRKRSA